MGILHYADSCRVTFTDRELTHLRTVILAKLNVHENVVLTWLSEDKQHSIWLHPTIPLHFEFESTVTPELNPRWVEQLLALANSPTGLRLIDEPEQ